MHRFEHNESRGTGDSKSSVKKSIVDGTDGLTIRFLNKPPLEADFHMLKINEKTPGEFTVEEKKGDKLETLVVDEKALVKMAKDLKLNFIVDYMKDRTKALKGGGIKTFKVMKGGAKKTTTTVKKTSKKTSKTPTTKTTVKKASKKTSKKASKKASKTTVKAPKKTSKKAPKKASKKASKKAT